MSKRVRIVYNHLPRLRGEMRDAAARAVARAAHDVEAAAKQRAPVDTGALRNSIQTWFDGDLRAFIAPHVEYAIYVEYGTRRMAARPYMAPAAEQVRPAFIAAMKEIVRD